jgi:hypothetical protein
VELYLHSPNTSSWRGAQLKHRVNFTFDLTNIKTEEELYEKYSSKVNGIEQKKVNSAVDHSELQITEKSGRISDSVL